ncbi:MAG: bactofilin family protein [Nannocystales bacterium]
MFEFLRRKNAPTPEAEDETKALPAAGEAGEAVESEAESEDDVVLKDAVEAMLVDQAVPEPEPEPEPDFGTVNVIGSDTRIDGSLTTRTEVHLLGKIDGDVECISLTVEADAGVHGDVTATQNVVVRGKVVGNLMVEGKLTITDTGSVAGVVQARSMTIDDGAELSGRCSMSSSAS